MPHVWREVKLARQSPFQPYRVAAAATHNAVTVQHCAPPEGVMEQEAALIEAFRNAATYQVVVDAQGQWPVRFDKP